MKLVTDANLSLRVAEGLGAAGLDAVHVADLGLATAAWTRRVGDTDGRESLPRRPGSLVVMSMVELDERALEAARREAERRGIDVSEVVSAAVRRFVAGADLGDLLAELRRRDETSRDALTEDEELRIAAWDIARATGTDERLDPGLVDATLDLLSPSEMAAGRGTYARPVEIDAGASPQERLLAAVGRNPWRRGRDGVG